MIHSLELTHSQWLYRNDRTHTKARQNKADTLTEAINQQFARGMEGLHPSDCCLLHHSQHKLLHSPLVTQESWLASVKVAREAFSNDTATEIHQLRQSMRNWLTQGEFPD